MAGCGRAGTLPGNGGLVGVGLPRLPDRLRPADRRRGSGRSGVPPNAPAADGIAQIDAGPNLHPPDPHILTAAVNRRAIHLPGRFP